MNSSCLHVSAQTDCVQVDGKWFSVWRCPGCNTMTHRHLWVFDVLDILAILVLPLVFSIGVTVLLFGS